MSRGTTKIYFFGQISLFLIVSVCLIDTGRHIYENGCGQAKPIRNKKYST